MEFVGKRKDSEDGEKSQTDSEEAPYDPLKDLVEKKDEKSH